MTSPHHESPPLVVAVTGASGMVYARRLLHVLAAAERELHVVISPAAAQVINIELDMEVNADELRLEPFLPHGDGRVHAHHWMDFNAPVASGSFPTAGMVVCPCTMGTLGSIAAGIANNLIHRAADVHLKERRPLVLVPRETPLSLIHLENMARVARAGAVVLPACPGFYHRPQSIDDLVNFLAARILDQLGIAHGLIEPWGE